LLARARAALAERAGGRRLVLCVDDGQLLDDASAALVHQLVAGGEAFAIVSVRQGEAIPDALHALWKDELCERIELDGLSQDDVRALLDTVLGAPIDGASAAALWELTRGNALYLREVVRHGRERGLLAADGGVWRWRGALQVGTRLAELVELRIGDAGLAARRVLELAAVAAPLEVGGLDVGERAALATLEERELVTSRADGRRRLAEPAHPLHGESVRAQLPALRLGSIQTRLADAVEARGARRRDDRLRIASWRLEAGGGDGALFAEAAEHALAASDAALAERLARAALRAGEPAMDRAGVDFRARLALGRALAGSGKGEEAARLLAELLEQARSDAELAAAALAAARNLFWALGRGEDADAVLAGAAGRVRAREVRDELAAQRVRLEAAAGHPAAALATARELLRDATRVHERARVTASIGAVEALFCSGASEEAVAVVEATLPAAGQVREALPHAEPVLLGMRAIALRLAGRLVEATEHSERAYRLLLPRRSGPAVAVEGASLGLIWLARGRVATALRLCRESAALLRDTDPVGMLAFALGGVAQAAAQAGDGDAAAAAVAELERTALGHKAFAVEAALGRAWAAAAMGELTHAAALARAAADDADARGQYAYAVRALHELARLGDPAAAAPRLAALAGTRTSEVLVPAAEDAGVASAEGARIVGADGARVDGAFAGIAADHAAALVARDGAALLDAAERFADLDALLLAAEAAHAADAAHREGGREASARAAAARAALWLGGCEGAQPPTMLGAPDAAGLTRREREIALLAARGASSREIADRLVISVRTVDNHLASAYRKLGVSRREDLDAALSRPSAWCARSAPASR
jgi:DNA-binding CsgD family transcriptional regulator